MIGTFRLTVVVPDTACCYRSTGSGSCWPSRVVRTVGAVNEIGPQPELAKESWAQRAVRDLREFAIPVLRREVIIEEEDATAIRLVALCLAAQADFHRRKPLGDQFQEIAAGVTLLEHRGRMDLPKQGRQFCWPHRDHERLPYDS